MVGSIEPLGTTFQKATFARGVDMTLKRQFDFVDSTG